jgi:hypothetical protein
LLCHASPGSSASPPLPLRESVFRGGPGTTPLSRAAGSSALCALRACLEPEEALLRTEPQPTDGATPGPPVQQCSLFNKATQFKLSCISCTARGTHSCKLQGRAEVLDTVKLGHMPAGAMLLTDWLALL